MGIIYSLVAILGQSFTTIIDRLNFKRTKIEPQQLMSLLFFSMLVLLSLFILITRQPFPHFTSVSVGLIVLIGLVSFGGNTFDFLSLKADDVSLREPLDDFEPIVAGLVGYILFPSERSPGFLVAFLLSTVIVYWGTHRRKLRDAQKKGMLYMFIAVCLYGFLPSIYKATLDYISPSYITLFRVATILLLSALFFPHKYINNLSTKSLGYAILSGVACSIGAVASLYAISNLGVVLTMLLMLLGPLIRYSAGYFFLKEKVRRGEVVSSIALATIVLIAAALT